VERALQGIRQFFALVRFLEIEIVFFAKTATTPAAKTLWFLYYSSVPVKSVAL
jgi:hypothetical protein